MENKNLSIFINKNINLKPSIGQITSVEKKTLYVDIDLEGEVVTDVLKRRISYSLRKISSRSMFINNLKVKLSHLTSSIFIYQFTCSCEARFISCSMRMLSKRIQIHYPVCLNRDGNGSIRSSLIEHHVNIDHSIKANSSFKIIYKVSRRLSNTVRLHLNIVAAIVIRLGKSELCFQNK